jgi:hypothetical protein
MVVQLQYDLIAVKSTVASLVSLQTGDQHGGGHLSPTGLLSKSNRERGVLRIIMHVLFAVTKLDWLAQSVGDLLAIGARQNAKKVRLRVLSMSGAQPLDAGRA